MSDKDQTTEAGASSGSSGPIAWYDLFSRGARDWLRHNEKVREAVRDSLPEIISSSDILGSQGDRTVRVPVRFLEHYRFRLLSQNEQTGVGQGGAEPGDVLRQPDRPGRGGHKGEGGDERGGVEFVIELKVDDVVDWLWQELKLPNLEARTGGMEEQEYTREGWNRRGVRSRLDKRRSMKEAIKRRSMQKGAGPAITDEDLRYRQLVKRQMPATQAAVIFAMDVSASMTEADRQLAKTFFFWVVQGLKRQYRYLTPVFIAHTAEAWEFDEEAFFQVSGTGGTVASTAFQKARDIIDERFDPSRFNLYLFYASDGQNHPHDRASAREALDGLSRLTNYMGYVEVGMEPAYSLETELAGVFQQLIDADVPAGIFPLTRPESLWDAIRAFFQDQAHESEAG
ncbi:MAG: DUF444 family protein [Gammaproteobacteria bacterium]|nr:DUF444 family protein [Gammaproteobacteria bacterium]